MKTGADVLNEVLKELDIKAPTLAKKVGLPYYRLSNIQLGRVKTISGDLARAINKEYPQFSMNYLLTGEREAPEKKTKTNRNRIPLYDTVATIGGNKDLVADLSNNQAPTEFVDAGDWFPTATAAITHYGDSMVEYPSGCILVLKRVNDIRLLVSGSDYVVETSEFRITKKLQWQEGWDYIMAHSTNTDTYPDGSQVYGPIKIPLDTVRHIDLVLGSITRRFANGPITIMER